MTNQVGVAPGIEKPISDLGEGSPKERKGKKAYGLDLSFEREGRPVVSAKGGEKRSNQKRGGTRIAQREDETKAYLNPVTLKKAVPSRPEEKKAFDREKRAFSDQTGEQKSNTLSWEAAKASRKGEKEAKKG